MMQARTIAAHGHRAASSDVGVAVALLGAGLRGARLNVEINLEGLGDAEYVQAVAIGIDFQWIGVILVYLRAIGKAIAIRILLGRVRMIFQDLITIVQAVAIGIELGG